MKYLKIFEGYNKDDYYVRVATVDGDVRKKGYSSDNENLKRFNSVEIDIIFRNIPDKECNITWNKEYCCLEINKSASTNYWFVYRFGDDEWIWAYDDTMNISYRCDQIEGLLKLLKDKWRD